MKFKKEFSLNHKSYLIPHRSSLSLGFTSLLTFILVAAALLPITALISKSLTKNQTVSKVASTSRVTSAGDACSCDRFENPLTCLPYGRCGESAIYCIQNVCHENPSERGGPCGNTNDCAPAKGLTCNSDKVCQDSSGSTTTSGKLDILASIITNGVIVKTLKVFLYKADGKTWVAQDEHTYDPPTSSPEGQTFTFDNIPYGDYVITEQAMSPSGSLRGSNDHSFTFDTSTTSRGSVLTLTPSEGTASVQVSVDPASVGYSSVAVGVFDKPDNLYAPVYRSGNLSKHLDGSPDYFYSFSLPTSASGTTYYFDASGYSVNGVSVGRSAPQVTAVIQPGQDTVVKINLKLTGRVPGIGQECDNLNNKCVEDASCIVTTKGGSQGICVKNNSLASGSCQLYGFSAYSGNTNTSGLGPVCNSTTKCAPDADGWGMCIAKTTAELSKTPVPTAKAGSPTTAPIVGATATPIPTHANGWCTNSNGAAATGTGAVSLDGNTCNLTGAIWVKGPTGDKDPWCTANKPATPYYYNCTGAASSSTGPTATPTPTPNSQAGRITEICAGVHQGIDLKVSDGYLGQSCASAGIGKSVTDAATKTILDNSKWEKNKVASGAFCPNATPKSDFGYDVFKCKDSSYALDPIGTPACDNNLWCPTSTTPGPTGVPTLGPTATPTPTLAACGATGLAENTPCDAHCGTNQCGGSGTNLACTIARGNPSQSFCCPGGTQYCYTASRSGGGLGACISASTACGPTPTPLPSPTLNPTQAVVAGCQGSDVVCATNSTGAAPNDPVAQNASHPTAGTSYSHDPSGDPACNAFYATYSTGPHPYCWRLNVPPTPTPTPISISGGGRAGDGAACTQGPAGDGYCRDNAPSLYTAGDRACTNPAWTGPSSSDSSQSRCCNYNQRWCTTTNTCESIQATCPASYPTSTPIPGTPPPTTYACITKDGRCYQGDPKFRCCTQADYPGGSLPADLQCVPKTATDYACEYNYSSSLTPTTAPVATTAPATLAQTCAGAPSAKAQCGSSGGPSDPNFCGGNYRWVHPVSGTDTESFCLSNFSSTPYCYVCDSASTASVGEAVSINSCTLNTQCVNNGSGNACVFSGKSLTGFCRKL